MSDKQFTLYWLDGKRQVITGETIEQAYTAAGYGAGAIKAVDFYIDGDNHEYDWNKEKRTWDRKTPLEIESLINHPVDKVNDYGYGISTNLMFTQMPEPTEDVYVISQRQADEIAQSIENNPGKYKLMVSQNLGMTYLCEYSTDDQNDPEIHRRIEQAKEKSLRYYVDGDDGVICDQHKNIIEFFSDVNLFPVLNRNPDLNRGKGVNMTVHPVKRPQRSIEEQAALLRSKFGK